MKNYSVIHLWAALLFFPAILKAQVSINVLSTVTNVSIPGGSSSQTIAAHNSSVNGVQPSTNYTVGYNNNGNIRITDFTYSGKSYVRYSVFDTVIVRRVANTWETTSGNKQHIYCQGPNAIDNVNHTMPFPVAFPQVTGHAYMERVMKEGLINRGSDNVFNNDASSDLTFTNIERVDFVYKTGISATNASSAGFLIAERGGNDPFKIAAITGIDANGNPTSFGPVLSVATAAYGAVITNAATYVMRKDVSDNVLRPFSQVPPQGIRSVFIRLSDLGVVALQEVYGYALMGNDVTVTTSAQLLSYTNSTYFPRTTTTSNGGMDMASAPGIFHTDQVLAVQFLNLKAQPKNCEQLLSWDDDEFEQVKEYQVEKSVNGEDFVSLGAVRTGNSANYFFTDKSFTASSWYRIKVFNHSGSHYYSSTFYAKCNCGQVSFSLYPNPATDYVTVSFNNTSSSQRELTVYSKDGKREGSWLVNGASRMVQIDVRNLRSGSYFIKVNEANQPSKAYQFLKQ